MEKIRPVEHNRRSPATSAQAMHRLTVYATKSSLQQYAEIPYQKHAGGSNTETVKSQTT
jgi:hypothetical protein